MCPGCYMNNNYLVQFEYGNKRETSFGSLLCVCSKDGVVQNIDESISDLPPK